ncbi:MAG TPA: DUF3472 domain-containing protein [Acidimicrobiales bacterium]|nr:DUF3472 domain-containing protein [Acidimicrobiales bacterium]
MTLPLRKGLRKGRATPCQTYTEWRWPPSTSFARTLQRGYLSFEHVLVPETDPGPEATYFWAHQFRMIGGEGGYIGLQTKGNRADGSLGKMAIFSIWDAVEAEGPGTIRFGGEGTGWSCRIPYQWQAGQAYTMKVFTPGGSWWGAKIRDETTGQISELGGIRVPEHWRHLDSWSVMWTEYYGPPLNSCRDLPYSSVVFGAPTANDGEVKPAGSHSHLGEGTCETSFIEPLVGGVRHQMGLPG